MSDQIQLKDSSGGLSVSAYRSDASALLAFNLDSNLTAGLAGFAIKCTPPSGTAFYLQNRLNFETAYTSQTTPNQRVWTPTNLAPIQKFRWGAFPPSIKPGNYTYDVSAMFFAPQGGPLVTGPTASVCFDFPSLQSGQLGIGFTRGYLSSQAYTDHFPDPSLWPGQMQGQKRTMDYDTASLQEKYTWLGYNARRMIFNFIQECVDDPEIEVHLFAYDLDEPDFIRDLQKLGPRLKAVLDNAKLHTKAGALEIKSKAALVASAGAANIHSGHFARFAHHKVIIQVKGGTAIKVLTGSANFSVRGLYVQANNILVFDDPYAAGLYEKTFQKAFNDMGHFKSDPIAKQWWPVDRPGMPLFQVAFSPHKAPTFSLQAVSDAIMHAQKSILFAVMELSGSGDVLDQLKNLNANRPDLFSFGISQSDDGLSLFKSGVKNGLFADFAYLNGKVPPPFNAEFSGGSGMVIHDKFVVVDFNGDHPILFTGSSNLAEGGEEQNGDNLIILTDPTIVTAYAVEAIRLVDHYHFRMAMKGATDEKPMHLQPAGALVPWWKDYYDPASEKYQERLMFVA
jgi:hypothetical protein